MFSCKYSPIIITLFLLISLFIQCSHSSRASKSKSPTPFPSIQPPQYGYEIGFFESQSNQTSTWSSITSSSDGSKLAVAQSPGYLYISSNNGIDWSRCDVHFSLWQTIAGSSNLLYLVAGIFGDSPNGGLFVSSDTGVSWTRRTSSSNDDLWQCVAISNDGKHIVAAISGGPLYTSSDFGTVWAPSASFATEVYWSALAIDSTGKIMSAVDNQKYVYLSSDYGIVWSKITIESDIDRLSLVSIASSSSASTPTPSATTLSTSSADSDSDSGGNSNGNGNSNDDVFLAALSSTGRLYTSSNSHGLIWKLTSSQLEQDASSSSSSSSSSSESSERFYTSIICSSTCEQMAVASVNGRAVSVWTSHDYGANWNESIVPVNVKAITAYLAADASGSRLALTIHSAEDGTKVFMKHPAPTFAPTNHPTFYPSSVPSSLPSSRPSAQPVAHPTSSPTSIPTSQPSMPTSQPSSQPSSEPTMLFRHAIANYFVTHLKNDGTPFYLIAIVFIIFSLLGVRLKQLRDLNANIIHIGSGKMTITMALLGSSMVSEFYYIILLNTSDKHKYHLWAIAVFTARLSHCLPALYLFITRGILCSSSSSSLSPSSHLLDRNSMRRNMLEYGFLCLFVFFELPFAKYLPWLQSGSNRKGFPDFFTLKTCMVVKTIQIGISLVVQISFFALIRTTNLILSSNYSTFINLHMLLTISVFVQSVLVAFRQERRMNNSSSGDGGNDNDNDNDNDAADFNEDDHFEMGSPVGFKKLSQVDSLSEEDEETISH